MVRALDMLQGEPSEPSEYSRPSAIMSDDKTDDFVTRKPPATTEGSDYVEQREAPTISNPIFLRDKADPISNPIIRNGETSPIFNLLGPIQDRRMSDEWDASKVPPSRFQKRKGSIYSTPSSRDGHVDSNYAAAFHEKHAEKGYGKNMKR